MPPDCCKNLMPYLTNPVCEALLPLRAETPLEEIRIRAGQPMQLVFSFGEKLIPGATSAAFLQEKGISELVSRICRQSVYAYAAELSLGFLTLPGGFRVGVSGRCIEENGTMLRMLDIVYLNIRIPRAVPGRVFETIPLLTRGGRPVSTLVVSRPGCGKTTFLRELIRLASTGCKGLCPGKVGVVDTRFELAALSGGVPYFDLGPRTDVRSGGDKAGGMWKLLTSMSPEILATDEIGSEADADAIFEARRSGVTVFASAHADGLNALVERSALKRLVENGVFERYVLLSRRFGPGTVEAVYSTDGKRVAGKEEPCRKLAQC